MNASVVPLENALGDGEAQAFALAKAGIQAVKDLKDLFLVVRGNSDAVVADLVFAAVP